MGVRRNFPRGGGKVAILLIFFRFVLVSMDILRLSWQC